MTATTKNNDIRQLDELTGGAFSAPTSGERATRVRAWLARVEALLSYVPFKKNPVGLAA